MKQPLLILIIELKFIILVNDLISVKGNFLKNSITERFLSPKNDETELNYDRIFQGWIPETRDFPWMARIMTNFVLNDLKMKKTKSLYRTCGGALISPDWIITARHCMSPYSNKKIPNHFRVESIIIKAFLGSQDNPKEARIKTIIGRKDYLKPQCRYRAKWCPLWGLFMDKTYTNDIALLQLFDDVKNSTIFPISLPPSSMKGNKLTGKVAYVSGWGIFDKRNPRSITKALRAAEQKIMEPNFTRFCLFQNSFGKLCASQTGNSALSGAACPGDSGSPLVMFDHHSNEWILVGILSNGHKDCFRGLPAIYTKVEEYMSWIHRAMSGGQYLPEHNVIYLL